MSRNSTTISAAVKLGIFTLASVLVTGLLAAIMGNFGFGSSKEYQAIFTSASMLEKGDDVRIAGVSVGEVKSVDHYERNGAIVTFKIKSDVPLTTASRAEIRFLNLVGDRYLALEEGSDANAQPLSDGGTIPVSHTSPALDLTGLFNGFQPLFQALDTLDRHHEQLTLLVAELEVCGAARARDRKTIGSWLHNISNLTAVVA